MVWEVRAWGAPGVVVWLTMRVTPLVSGSQKLQPLMYFQENQRPRCQLWSGGRKEVKTSAVPGIASGWK
ncbi:MAG: hypothetical protein BWZ02_03334 [Lentisphaerae bacterium ADurb.BinA184]|nr:MAG: hypothetical protein BWZ02_03334 [Lentisphaerae bacterium ADurb.BinA184]